jgi:hypothetical protein
MGRRRPYTRKTDYVPQEDRRFIARPVHREEPDLSKLTEAFVRLALQRVADARQEREQTRRPSTVKAGNPPAEHRTGS